MENGKNLLLLEITRCWNLLSGIFEFSEVACKIKNLDDLWKEVDTFCREIIGAAGIVIIKYEPLECKIIFNSPNIKKVIKEPNSESSSVREVFQSGGYLLKANITDEDRKQWGLGNISVGTLLVIPIKIGDAVWGAIAAWRNKKDNIFTAEEYQSFQLYSSQIRAILTGIQLAEEQVKTWRRFSLEVANLIKDPVTLMAIWLEELKNHLDPKIARENDSYFKNIENQLKEMDNAIRQCFLFNVNPSSKIRSSTSLLYLLEKVIKQFPLKRMQRFDLQNSNECSGLRVNANELRLGIALREILLSALSLTSSRGKVHVKLSFSDKDKQAVIGIAIHKEGIHVPSGDKKKLFDLDFYLETNNPNLKISLMLAKQIIEEHDGTMAEVGKAENELIFEVKLPVLKGDKKDDAWE